MRVLIVKTSSLGDIVHTLPAVTDAARAIPTIQFDWLVEDAFKEIPLLHPAVKRVIPITLREWRKNRLTALRNGEIRSFLRELRKVRYDYVLDAQGLLKSSLIARCSRGPLAGFAWSSAREPLASLFYHKKTRVSLSEHAVFRIRLLFSESLGYSLAKEEPSYGIELGNVKPKTIGDSEPPYVVFLHGTTWGNKHWPEQYWIALAKYAVAAGLRIKVLWGNTFEFSRAKRMAEAVAGMLVMPTRLTLTEVMAILAKSRGVVAVDTGLGHLTAALGVPCISLYGPTDASRCGTIGAHQVQLVSEFACAPCRLRTCTHPNRMLVDPPCFLSLQPEKVWSSLQNVL